MFKRHEPEQSDEFVWIDGRRNGKIRSEKMESYKNIFSIHNIAIYLAIINIIGFLAMWLDKRKAKKGVWRISEQTLFYITLLGGGFGTIAGMYMFRHKTKKLRFTIGLPVILVSEIVLFGYLIFKYII